MKKTNLNREGELYSKTNEEVQTYGNNVVLSNECTGLYPTPPKDGDENNAYSEIRNTQPRGADDDDIISTGFQDKCSRSFK